MTSNIVTLVPVEVDNLGGAALDWVIDTLVRQNHSPDNPVDRPQSYTFRPSSAWAIGGPLIESYGINTGKAEWKDNQVIRWAASTSALFQGGRMYFGSSPLEAAMRCLVGLCHDKPTVMVPKVLVQQAEQSSTPAKEQENKPAGLTPKRNKP